MINITLPDGSRREFDAPVSVLQVAQSIGGLFVHVDITNGLVPPDWPETDLDEIYAVLEAGNPAWPAPAARPTARWAPGACFPPVQVLKVC